MKHRLPILPAIALGIVGAVGAGVFVAQSAKPRPAATTAASTRPAANTPTPRAGELIQQAAEQLARRETLAAKVVLNSGLFDESLVATGQYLQGPRDSRRIRLELRVKVGEKVCSLQQVSDGQAVWIQEASLHQSRLGRIDVQRALAALQQAGYRPGVDVLALGGLPMLLDNLRRAFDFQAVRTDKTGTVPTMVAVGVWKPATLAHLLPDQRPAIEAGGMPDMSKLPAYMPNQVEVHVGRDDLFPHQIDYLRTTQQGTRSDDDLLLARIKFVDVRFDVAIDPAQFVFQPGEKVPVDETEAFVRRTMPR